VKPTSIRPARSWGHVTYSLRNRNFRRYMLGQGLSQAGLWMQQTAEMWLILEITGSGAALGLYALLRNGPVLLLGAPAGVLSDRYDRRKLLILTQSLHALCATTLAASLWIEAPSLTLIYAVVLAQGIVNAVDNPLRRAFVRDLVTDDELSNAVSLKSTVGTVTRTVGPAIAGLVIAGWGVNWCFTVNALSYAAVLIGLIRIEPDLLRPAKLLPRGPGQVRAGFRYAWGTVNVRTLLLLAAVVGVFGWSWQVLVPAYAADTFQGSAALYGLMLSSVGIGSLLGALAMAREGRIGTRYLSWATAALALALAGAALSTTVPLAFISLALIGATGTVVIIGTQSLLQLTIDDSMSGRILAIFSVAFTGSKPVGGVIGGTLIDLSGPRLAFGVSALAIGATSLWLRIMRKALQPA